MRLEDDLRKVGQGFDQPVRLRSIELHDVAVAEVDAWLHHDGDDAAHRILNVPRGERLAVQVYRSPDVVSGRNGESVKRFRLASGNWDFGADHKGER